MGLLVRGFIRSKMVGSQELPNQEYSPESFPNPPVFLYTERDFSGERDSPKIPEKGYFGIYKSF